LEPYALYPLNEYFGGVVSLKPVSVFRNRHKKLFLSPIAA
jgi:hypothetical protein